MQTPGQAVCKWNSSFQASGMQPTLYSHAGQADYCQHHGLAVGPSFKLHTAMTCCAVAAWHCVLDTLRSISSGLLLACAAVLLMHVILLVLRCPAAHFARSSNLWQATAQCCHSAVASGNQGGNQDCQVRCQAEHVCSIVAAHVTVKLCCGGDPELCGVWHLGLA